MRPAVHFRVFDVELRRGAPVDRYPASLGLVERTTARISRHARGNWPRKGPPARLRGRRYVHDLPFVLLVIQRHRPPDACAAHRGCKSANERPQRVEPRILTEIVQCRVVRHVRGHLGDRQGQDGVPGGVRLDDLEQTRVAVERERDRGGPITMHGLARSAVK